MPVLLIAIGLAILGSLGGLLLASTLLLFKDSVRVRLVPWLVSYAVGTLLGVALLDLLPESLESLSRRRRSARCSSASWRSSPSRNS